MAAEPTEAADSATAARGEVVREEASLAAADSAAAVREVADSMAAAREEAVREEASSFPKPNLSRRSQQRRRPGCPSMHNG